MFAFLMIVLLLALWASSTTVTATDWLSVCLCQSRQLVIHKHYVLAPDCVWLSNGWGNYRLAALLFDPWTYWYRSCLIRLSAVCQQQNNRQQFVIIVSIAIHWANLLLIWVENVSWNVCKLKFHYGRHVSFDSSFQRISSLFLNFLFKVGRRTFPPK